ncbi:hypothetical protein AAHA92_02583 [Salvia divinorum]|uniref:Uncharacterized protein n=1 Tax=Salvia divinorum TaxID=28513 RepID=A0ABD1IGZ5_SALDI
MKFLFELVACCGSSSSEKRRPPDDARLLVVQEPFRRAVRKQNRARGHEWRPSLSSISEDVLTARRINSNVQQPAKGWQRSLKRKVTSISQRDRRRSPAHDDCWRAHMSTVMPTFSPAPFMF